MKRARGIFELLTFVNILILMMSPTTMTSQSLNYSRPHYSIRTFGRFVCHRETTCLSDTMDMLLDGDHSEPFSLEIMNFCWRELWKDSIELIDFHFHEECSADQTLMCWWRYRCQFGRKRIAKVLTLNALGIQWCALAPKRVAETRVR